ncbi:MAG: hypothetical protein IKS40_04515 [Treponema sp.]|nr:hypothetical protein [Treponema sp.]
MSEEEMQAMAQAHAQEREILARAQMMKKIGRRMSILMGVSLSFCLSLLGNLTSGHFTLPGFLISFAVSTLISLIIGFLVPMKKVGDGLANALHLKPRSLPAHCAESFVSDLIYTPVITLAMVALAWKMATSHGAQMPFLPMFLHSLVLSMIVGYVLIFILMPVFFKLTTRGQPPLEN